MTNKNKDISFKDILNKSIDESILEEFYNSGYGGTNALGSSQSPTSNRYSPANVRKAPPLRYANDAIEMGQSDKETQSPKQLMYPLEGIFSEMVDIYLKAESMKKMIEETQKLANITDAKKKSLKEASLKMKIVIENLKSVIEAIEEVTV